MTSCAFCTEKSQYRDRNTGQHLCLKHARLEIAAAPEHAAEQDQLASPLSIRPATATDYARIKELSHYFWEETDVDCFDRQYDVLACPAFLACDGDDVVGLASYAVEVGWDAIVLVMLNLLPGYQGRGAGWALLDAMREEAVERDLRRVLVVTSNDDLPALALYQRYGFRLTEVIPGRIASHHGASVPGFAGILVLDELRLALDVGT
jgi:ribosomal protein S18 acetylase RimI-like enzyme